MLLLLLLLFSPFVYSINSVNNGCIITYTRIQVKANCVAMGINFIPNDLPPTITYLDLSENKIPILRNSSFVNYKNLVSITIDKNPLSSIDGNAFIGLDRLQLLSMQNNKLDLATSYHQDVFRPLYSLRKLDIRSNTVYQLQHGRSIILILENYEAWYFCIWILFQSHLLISVVCNP